MPIFSDIASNNCEHRSSRKDAKRLAMEEAYFPFTDINVTELEEFREFQEAMRMRSSEAETVAEWEAEYDEYLQSCDEMEFEAANDNGFEMIQYDAMTPVEAERGCLFVMGVLNELRHRAVEHFTLGYTDGGSPQLQLYFHDFEIDAPGKASVTFQVKDKS